MSNKNNNDCISCANGNGLIYRALIFYLPFRRIFAQYEYMQRNKLEEANIRVGEMTGRERREERWNIERERERETHRNPRKNRKILATPKFPSGIRQSWTVQAPINSNRQKKANWTCYGAIIFCFIHIRIIIVTWARHESNWQERQGAEWAKTKPNNSQLNKLCYCSPSSKKMWFLHTK